MLYKVSRPVIEPGTSHTKRDHAIKKNVQYYYLDIKKIKRLVIKLNYIKINLCNLSASIVIFPLLSGKCI